MVCTSVHRADDCCWLVPFGLWVHENELKSLGHDLHVKMHPFQAPQCPADGLVLGRVGKNEQDRNDTSWVVPLSMEVMIADDTFHLACGYVGKH